MRCYIKGKDNFFFDMPRVCNRSTYSLYFLLLFVLVRTHTALSTGRQIRWDYEFKPLIGGPKFLKFHVSTRVSFVECPSTGLVIDFVPASENISIATTKYLITGGSTQGHLRTRVVRGPQFGICDDYRDSQNINDNNNPSDYQLELQSLGKRWIAETLLRWKGIEEPDDCVSCDLNIYTSNCYHFAFWLSLVLLKEKKSRASNIRWPD